MTDATLLLIARDVAVSGRITADQVIEVRRCVYGGDCSVSREEAEGIYAIERARTAACREWSDFFVEALTDYVLNQEPPTGYLSEDNAAWVVAQVGKRRQPSMDGDMALVANLIEKAREVPVSFSAFALRLAKDAVLWGEGPDGRGRSHFAGKVDAADIAMLERILWGAGSEGLLAVSREEAEALFAIADATTGADNVADFENLFARAIGNYLLGATGRSVPPRDVALKWQTEAPYKADVVKAVGNVMGVVFGRRVPNVLTTQATTLAQEIEDEHAHRNMVRDVEIEVASILSPDKAQWLKDRIDRNGVMNGPERALVRFVEREAGALGLDFKAVAAKVA